jgi:predicted Zn-dependent peptidase
MEDVKSFFATHYHPANAILCIAGNFELEEIRDKVTKWFGDIPEKLKPARILPAEPEQTEFREKILERNVPTDAFYYAFKMAERRSDGYYFADLLSDCLGRDKSSRLYIALKKEQKLVSEIGAYISGDLDNGLLIISGKLNPGVTFDMLDKALWEALDELKKSPMEESELSRLMIKIRTAREFQEQGLLNRAMNLCNFELLGDANGINEEHLIYQAIQPDHLQESAIHLFRKENCSLLKVKSMTND